MNTLTKTFLLLIASLLPLPGHAEDGHRYDYTIVSGNRIAWSCEGSGSPTVALIAGMGLDAHRSFSRIYHNFDGESRICMYDRAGMGESEFTHPAPRSLGQLADELHEVAVQNEWGNLVLVAHSFGGFIAREYVSRHPGAVSGVLFVDAPHEDWLPNLEEKMSLSDWAIMARILGWNIDSFHEDYVEGQERVRKARFPADMPITVVSRGIPHTQIRLEKMSYEGIDLFDGVHNALQLKLAELSSNSEHRIARYSSHLINDYDPWLVLDEIEQLTGRIPD